MTGTVGVARRKTGLDLGADEFLAGLKDTFRHLRLRSAAELDDFGRDAADTIRDKAPRGVTGQLAESVGHDAGHDLRGPYVDVFVGEFYASFHEWGTSRIPARPFYRPGLAQAAGSWPGLARRLLAGAARRLTGR